MDRAAFNYYLPVFCHRCPFWGKLSTTKGRKLMLLRSALGVAIVMLLMGFCARCLAIAVRCAPARLLGGSVPNANALIATQVPVTNAPAGR